MHVQNSGPKFYHLRHFKKEKRCSLNFCTDYSTINIVRKYFIIMPELKRLGVVFCDKNLFHRKSKFGGYSPKYMEI